MKWPSLCGSALLSQNDFKTGETIGSVRGNYGAIDFPKMFRAPLGRLGTERFTVARHQHRDLTERLSKMKQGTVNFRGSSPLNRGEARL
jgi:hypothetical protein